MNLVGFIGTYDKKDVELNIAKVLTDLNFRILIVDATLMQRLRYLVPNISNNNSNRYISNYLGIDVALGFVNFNEIMQYLGTNELPYDFVIVDSDNYQTTQTFGIADMNKVFLFTSYDQAELNRTVESISRSPKKIMAYRVALSADLEDKQSEYFYRLFQNLPIEFSPYVVDFADSILDRKVILENQLLREIRFKHYSDTYKGSLEYLTALVAEGIIEQAKIKKVIRRVI